MAWKSLPEVPDRLKAPEWPSMFELQWLPDWPVSKDDSLEKLKAMALSEMEENESELEENESELEENESELEEPSNKWADGFLVDDVITLFRSFGVEFLVSGKGDKVPISDLEGKDVGLFFYSPLSSDFVLRELNYMYEELRKQGKYFQLVVICIHRMVPKAIKSITWHVVLQMEELLEKKFQNFFNGTTWLALPFCPCLSPSSRSKSTLSFHQWSRTLRDSYEPAELVIIQPNENIAHAYAMDIFREFGIEAYPFSKSKLIELQVARLKSFKLQQLLCSVLKLPESFMLGKKILLILHPLRLYEPENHERLMAWSEKMQQKDKELEIISMCYEGYGDRRHVMRRLSNGTLFLRYNVTLLYEMTGILKYMGMRKKIKANKSTMVLAFGPDGRFITMTSSEKLFSDDECDSCQTQDFFDDAHLSSQVSYNIAIEKGWCSLHEDGVVHGHARDRWSQFY